MAQIKYKETQRLRQMDLIAAIGMVIVLGVFAFVQVVLSGPSNKSILILMALGIMILAGIFYYLNSIRIIARYNEKSIRLSLMPVGTVKRKILWEDVVESEIIELPRESRRSEWNVQWSGLEPQVSKRGLTCLHLRLKNNEEINIGCSNPKELKEFVEHVKDYHPGLDN